MSLSLEDYTRKHGSKISIRDLIRLIESSDTKVNPKQLLDLLQKQSPYTPVRPALHYPTHDPPHAPQYVQPGLSQ